MRCTPIYSFRYVCAICNIVCMLFVCLYTVPQQSPYIVFLQKIRDVGSQLGIEPLVIQGKELQEKGFGGEAV